MANKSTVANDLRRFATFVKGLTDAADMLDQMQQIEEEANANTARVAEAKTQLQEVQAQVDGALAELADAKKAAADTAAKAKVRAGNVIEAAEQQAAVRAQDMIAAAQGQADAVVADGEQKRAVLLDQLTGLGDQLLRMQEDETALRAAIKVSQDELDATDGKLAAARESIAKLLG